MSKGNHRSDQKLRCRRCEEESRGAAPAEPYHDAQSGDHFFYQRADAVVRRLFIVGSDLHAVRSRVDAPSAACYSASQIDDAIRKVDAAINDLRYMIFELQTGDENGPDGLRINID